MSMSSKSETRCQMLGIIPGEAMHSHEQNRRVWSVDGLSPTVYTFSGGGQETKIAIYENDMPEQQG